MATEPTLKGYGPKNPTTAHKSDRASLSFLKLIKEKITFEDKAAMRHIFTQIVTSLQAESPLAAALDRKGYILWNPRISRGLKRSAKFATFHAVHVKFDQTCTWTHAYVNEIAEDKPITRMHVPLTAGDLHTERFNLDSVDALASPDFRIEDHRHPT